MEGHLAVLHGQVPLPSQASLAWNMLLSVSNSAVYTPSGKAAVSAAEESTEDAASEEAALEAAEDAVEEAPQPTSRLSAREADDEHRKNGVHRKYLYIIRNQLLLYHCSDKK